MPESEKATSEEYAVAKWLKANVPTKKTKFLNHHVEYFTGKIFFHYTRYAKCFPLFFSIEKKLILKQRI